MFQCRRLEEQLLRYERDGDGGMDKAITVCTPPPPLPGHGMGLKLNDPLCPLYWPRFV